MLTTLLPAILPTVRGSIIGDVAGSVYFAMLWIGLMIVAPAACMLRRWNTIIAMLLAAFLVGILMPGYAS